jgi:NRPS condensation-like uncharacterized protein
MVLIIRRMLPGEVILIDHDPVPAAVPDQWNFLLSGIWSQVAHLVLRFEGPLERERLGRAVERLIQAEPLLGSRFAEGDAPSFRPVEGLTLSDLLVSRPGGAGEPETTLGIPGPDAIEGPMIRITHLFSGFDTLVLSINHTLCDARGMKHIAALLARFYREPEAPFPAPDPGSRGFSGLLVRFGPAELRTARLAAGETSRIWGVPMGRARSGTRLISRTLPHGIFDSVHAWCRARGFTLNDLFLAAYYDALSPFRGDTCGHLPVLSSMDLRRLAPGTIAECANGSVAFEVWIPPFDSPESLVEVVHSVMATHKRDRTGLGVALRQQEDFAEGFSAVRNRLRELEEFGTRKEEKMSPFFSNTGILSPEHLDFGGPGVRDACILPPVEYPPGFGLAVSTFSGRITLSAGFCSDALPGSRAEAILARMEAFIRERADTGL